MIKMSTEMKNLPGRLLVGAPEADTRQPGVHKVRSSNYWVLLGTTVKRVKRETFFKSAQKMHFWVSERKTKVRSSHPTHHHCLFYQHQHHLDYHRVALYTSAQPVVRAIVPLFRLTQKVSKHLDQPQEHDDNN